MVVVVIPIIIPIVVSVVVPIVVSIIVPVVVSVVNSPSEQRAHVVAVIVTTGLFGIIAERSLVDANIIVIARVSFDDVI